MPISKSIWLFAGIVAFGSLVPSGQATLAPRDASQGQQVAQSETRPTGAQQSGSAGQGLTDASLEFAKRTSFG
jgi:hypothetical protein